MKKKTTKAMPSKKKGPTADDHRKLADMHRAKSRLHEAKADMLDVDNPPKGPKNKIGLIGRY
jgi:hypothetical protein